jgi:hypothetical protein
MTRLACRKCHSLLVVPDASTGQLIRCPACGTLLYRHPTKTPAADPTPSPVAAAQPVPDPIPLQETPSTGLTPIQKIGFGVVAACLVSVVAVWLVNPWPIGNRQRDDEKRVVADTSSKPPHGENPALLSKVCLGSGRVT